MRVVVRVIVEPLLHEIAPAGTLLELAASEWAYGDGPLTLRVARDRVDLSRYYDNLRWLEGWRLDAAGVPVEWLQALVPVEVILQQTKREPDGRQQHQQRQAEVRQVRAR